MASTTTTAKTASTGGVLTISQDPSIVTVIERFDVPKDDQDAAVEAACKHIAKTWKSASDFIGAVLLKSRISGNISVYAQWKRPTEEKGAAPLAPTAKQSLAAALKGYPTQVSKTFSVEFSALSPTFSPPMRVSVERTPAGHFGIFPLSVERQNRMVDLARANGPKSLGTPGLLAINFHRSLDGEHVINFGQWSYIETDFNKLMQQPGFKPDDNYWEGVAEGEPDFFDIVAVETKE